MANLNEQIARAWDEWESQTGDEANDPDDFIDWAVKNGRMVPRPEDVLIGHGLTKYGST